MTTAVALLLAFAVLFASGGGLVLLVARNQMRFGACEFAALSWLFGTGSVSLFLWLGGLLTLRGAALQTAVATISIALLVAGWRRTSRAMLPRFSSPTGPAEWILAAFLLLELGMLLLGSYKHTLGWDGVVNWEAKARYAFLNGGALPAEYYSSPGRVFTHPEYPLAIPFTELWLYLALGAAHQFWAKSIFLIYYATGAFLLAALATRLTGRRGLGLTIAALLFFTPQVTFGHGGAASGYADFALATIYLGAIGFLALELLGNNGAAFRFYAALLALLPWFKREGTILWLVAALAGVSVILRARERRKLLALLPGLGIILAWKLFLFCQHTVVSRDFVPLGRAAFAESLTRLGPIVSALGKEFTDLAQWSLLWPLLLGAAFFLVRRRRFLLSALLLPAIFVPLLLYCATYFFSAWPDVGKHIETSFPRLLLQIAPLAWLTIAAAIGAQWPLPSCIATALARNGDSAIDGPTRPVPRPDRGACDVQSDRRPL